MNCLENTLKRTFLKLHEVFLLRIELKVVDLLLKKYCLCRVFCKTANKKFEETLH